MIARSEVAIPIATLLSLTTVRARQWRGMHRSGQAGGGVLVRWARA
jgi:hypothetical protein